jgi:hypothetical protein
MLWRRASTAHDLTVAQPVGDTHLGRPGVNSIVPNEVLAHTWANIKLSVILFTILSQIYLYYWSTAERRSMRREARSAQRRREGEGVARDAELHLYHDIARGSMALASD